MSGASGRVPAAIHVTPESAAGGPLAKVRNGDVLRVDAIAGVLEARIAQAQDNVTAFNAEPGEGGRPIMINSSFACMACHQY